MSLNDPTQLLGVEDLKILQTAQAIVKSGISDTEGIALKVAAGKLLESQVNLSNLKGMLLYSLSFKKADLAREWQSISDIYSSERLPYHRVESYANVDPKYSTIKNEIAGFEALLAVIEDCLWAMRSVLKFYQP